MAEKRMFTKKISDSDAFIELSSASQALYFHLNQGADDDGFNNQVQNAMFKAHASIDDLKILMLKNFIIRFESGVIVIKHWRMHNTLRKDRYTPTSFQEELKQLGLKENGSYTLGCQLVAERLPQNSIDKNSVDKNSIDNIVVDEKSQQPPFIQLPLNDNSLFDISNEFVKEMTTLYPNVNIEQELRNMKGWLIGNPTKRKTKRGINRFITSWLSKAQDRGYTPQQNKSIEENSFYTDLK